MIADTHKAVGSLMLKEVLFYSEITISQYMRTNNTLGIEDKYKQHDQEFSSQSSTKKEQL